MGIETYGSTRNANHRNSNQTKKCKTKNWEGVWTEKHPNKTQNLAFSAKHKIGHPNIKARQNKGTLTSAERKATTQKYAELNK